MIEKIMKSVKRGNKKRSINITIGAVVGFLLSCTSVMGAENNYLAIKDDGGEIKFSKDNTDIIEANGTWDKINPYEENIWNEGAKTYTNNTTLSGVDNDKINGIGYGLLIYSDIAKVINNGDISAVITTASHTVWGIVIISLSSLINVEDLINDGNISAAVDTNRSSDAVGIYLNNIHINNIINRGNISADDSGRSTGIYLSDGVASCIENNGNIIGKGIDISYGINLEKDISLIINNGNIIGITTGTPVHSSAGIKIEENAEIIINRGNIIGIGNSSSYGIRTRLMENLITAGIVFGSTSAINIETSAMSPGKLTSGVNYGILANGSTTNDMVENGEIVDKDTSGENKISNYGLVFTVNGNDYQTKTNYNNLAGKIEHITINGVAGYTISNVALNGTVGATLATVTQNDTTLNTETKDKYVYNGLTNAVTIGGTAVAKVSNSVFNSYEDTIKFHGTNGGTLSLSGSIVNGGIKNGTFVILGGSGEDNLTLESSGASETESITGGNTVINGKIDMGAGNDNLTVGVGTIINGTLDGGLGDDTLNFVKSPTTRLTSNLKDSINILHNISGFENMNINADVTLFEKTIGADGSPADLKVTGVDNITIGENGVLTLRINSADSKKHALDGNTGTISSTNGGKLLLALNGAGNEEIIDFGNMTLKDFIVGDGGTLDATSLIHTTKMGDNNTIIITVRWNVPEIVKYEKLNKIYHGILSTEDLIKNFDIGSDKKKLSLFLGYLNDIYAGSPYSYSSELSRKSTGMFRDIVTENQFKADAGKWLIHGGLTHVDGGTKDTYYGKGYYAYDTGSNDIDADTKITGAYILGEYGVSDTLTSGVVIGGNKLKSDLSNGSKVEGNAMYLGAYAKKYLGNLKVTAGAGFQYGDYDADRLTVNNVASSIGTPMMKYSDNYNDMTYDIYINGRYSHNIGDNLFLEPYGTLSYTYINQDGADEGNKTLAIETDSKSFDYTTAKVGVDLKKVIPHEKGKSTISAGVSYTRILDGADEEFITGRFKGGTDFDILVAHKNEHSIGLNAKYSLELENGILFDVKGTYAVERDSHNQSGKNKTKGEWIVGAGLGYKF